MPSNEHNAATETETARVFILHNWTELGCIENAELIAPEETVTEAIERFLAGWVMEQEDRRYEMLAEEEYIDADEICAPKELIAAALADDSSESLYELLELAEDGSDPAITYNLHHGKVILGRPRLEEAEKAGRPIATECYGSYRKARGLLTWYVDLAAEKRLNGGSEEDGKS
jgi:hypothetical protein